MNNPEITPADGLGPRPYADAAIELHDAGLSPIPVGGKDDPVKGFTGKAGAYPSRADVQAWVEGPEASRNVAVRLSDDIIGIDVDAHSGKDGAATLSKLTALWGGLPPTWRSSSRDDGVSGIYLFRVPKGTDLSRAESVIRDIGDAIDVIRWDYRYVMAAPSTHPITGQTYRWFTPDGQPSTTPPKADGLPALPGEWLSPLTPKATVTLAPPPPDPGNEWHLPIRVGNRHATVLSRAGWMRKHDVPWPIAEAAALYWHSLCEQSAHNVATPSNVLAIVRDVYARYPADTQKTDEIPESLLAGIRNGGWLDGQEFVPLRYTVPDILPEGFGLLVGAPKIGKSWLTLLICLMVAAGESVLGQLVEQRPVLLLALEDGDRRMQDRCRILLGGKPIPPGLDYITHVEPGRIVGLVEEWLKAHAPDAPLVVIDTLGKCMPIAAPGESTYQRDYRIGGALKKLSDAWPGTSLVVNHHDRKAHAEDFIDSVSGTHGLAGAADTVIVLTRPRHEGAGQLQVSGRDVIEGEYALTFANGLWSLDGASLEEASRKARTARLVDALGERSTAIVSVVNSHPEGVRAEQVAKAVDLEPKVTADYLGRLASTGKISRFERGVYGPTDPAQGTTPPKPL